MDVFVAGALCLPEVREAVLGAGAGDIDAVPATLPDHRLMLCGPAAHPALLRQEGDRCDGLCLHGLTELQRAALTYYHGCFGQRPTSLVAEMGTGMCEVVAFRDDAPADGTPVSLAEWAQEWGAVAARMAAEIMAYHSRKPAEEMTKSLAPMRRRATAWCAARARPADPAHDLARDVVVHAHKREYVNFFAMEEMDLQHRKFDGSMGPVMNRGVALVGEAAVLLPYDPARDCVLLIEQFRAAIYIAGEAAPWTWEPPAGLIDPGETPEQAARREAKEEAGLDVPHLERVGSLYPSSGSSGEYIHIFCGLADLSVIEGGGGVPSEGEDIRSKVISFQELMAGVDDCTFQDMPLVTAALWLARHRDRLRAEFC